jgi:uncharacterized protein
MQCKQISSVRTDFKKNKRRTIMAGKFEVYQDKAGKYRFRLKAGNGEIIAAGEAYESKAGCLKGIESVKKNAPKAKVVEE